MRTAQNARLSISNQVSVWRGAAVALYANITQQIASATTSDPRRRAMIGVIAAIGGVTLASLLIGASDAAAHVDNISLLYLLVVIALAIVFGRLSATVSAVLAFVAYDYFFVPPVHYFTVYDPKQWLSLVALLVTGLVVGQLTAEVRHRERAAVTSHQRTAALYALAQDIAATAYEEDLTQTLAQRVISVFGPSGIDACALWLPTSEGLTLRASAHTKQDTMRQVCAPIRWREPTADSLLAEIPRTTSDSTQGNARMIWHIPLISGGQNVGVLSVAGKANLIAGIVEPQSAHLVAPAPQASFFAAFRDQIALALERAALQQTAIQVAALREGDRLKNALIDAVTHDVRTPMSVLQAASATLLQDEAAWNQADRREILTTMSGATARLGRLFDNLLALSQIEAGVTSPPKEPYPINDVIATVLDQLEAANVLTGHTIEVDVTEDPLEAPMDHAALERVLQNLVENAAKYSPPGSPITIRAWRTEDALMAYVMDQGIGIPTGSLAAIFTKFTRLRQPTPWTNGQSPHGAGLGLAICAGIIHEHGGAIWAESGANQGSAFYFTIPLAPTAPTRE